MPVYRLICYLVFFCAVCLFWTGSNNPMQRRISYIHFFGHLPMFRRTVSCCLCTFTGCFSQFFTVRFLDKYTFFGDSVGYTTVGIGFLKDDLFRVLLRQPLQFSFSFGSWVYTLAVDCASLYSTTVSSSYFDSFIGSYPGQIPDGSGRIHRYRPELPTHRSFCRSSASTARSCTPACRRAASLHDPSSA